MRLLPQSLPAPRRRSFALPVLPPPARRPLDPPPFPWQRSPPRAWPRRVRRPPSTGASRLHRVRSARMRRRRIRSRVSEARFRPPRLPSRKTAPHPRASPFPLRPASPRRSTARLPLPMPAHHPGAWRVRAALLPVPVRPAPRWGRVTRVRARLRRRRARRSPSPIPVDHLPASCRSPPERSPDFSTTAPPTESEPPPRCR